MQPARITRSFLVTLLSLLTWTVSIIPASAQIESTHIKFYVNTTADTHDVQPGDGKCADQNNQCSLRAAVEEVDTVRYGSSITITVPAGMYKLVLGTLELTAQSAITINGESSQSTIIDSNRKFRGMSISVNVSTHLNQLTIKNGNDGGNGQGGNIYNLGTLTITNSIIGGGRAYYGAGIYNHGMLTVSASILGNNSGITGSGIDNQGILTVSASIFSNNRAANSSSQAGGGIYNQGILTVSASTFRGNQATHGGGIYNATVGSMTVTNSMFSNNVADAGGGIYNGKYSTAVVGATMFKNNKAITTGTHGGGGIENVGMLLVSSSTFSDNSAPNGGGIYNGIDGSATIANSTLEGNKASYGGGGIYNTSTDMLTVTNSTLSNNSAPTGGGVYNDSSGTVTTIATIVANSVGLNCAGLITDDGYNLDSGTSCGFTMFPLNNTDPMLGPLRDNGGPTRTMSLLQGSPAIDYVIGGDCPATDQRGHLRPDNGESICDIGAYESEHST